MADKRKVWIMNLKDNRGNGENKNTDIKFNLCCTNHVLGIGWADDDYQSGKVTTRGFTRAKNCLDCIDVGDLVWVRNPVTSLYFICEVVDNKTDLDWLNQHFVENDISQVKNCKTANFYEFGFKGKLPSYLSYRNLISKETGRQVKNNQKLIDFTNDWFDKNVKK